MGGARDAFRDAAKKQLSETPLAHYAVGSRSKADTGRIARLRREEIDVIGAFTAAAEAVLGGSAPDEDRRAHPGLQHHG